MVSKKIILNNEDGLHARAAALFVRTANRYSSEVTLTAHGDSVNGKSIIGIMSLGAFSGEEVEIAINGVDENEAMEDLLKLIQNNFENI